jgi:hypothetical protein
MAGNSLFPLNVFYGYLLGACSFFCFQNGTAVALERKTEQAQLKNGV